MAEPEWESTLTFLRSVSSSVPAATANGRLLEAVESEWKGKVVPRTSMHDILFTLPGDDYPFRCAVRVSWADDVFTLSRTTAGAPTAVSTADASHAERELSAMLDDLVGSA